MNIFFWYLMWVQLAIFIWVSTTTVYKLVKRIPMSRFRLIETLVLIGIIWELIFFYYFFGLDSFANCQIARRTLIGVIDMSMICMLTTIGYRLYMTSNTIHVFSVKKTLPKNTSKVKTQGMIAIIICLSTVIASIYVLTNFFLVGKEKWEQIRVTTLLFQGIRLVFHMVTFILYGITYQKVTSTIHNAHDRGQL